MSHYFHFSMGPVQGFVSQARRTRDFWAGSFILSWLAGVGMVAVEEQGGEVLFPKPDVDFLQAIRQGAKGLQGPQQGSIPNRFMARVDSEFKPERVIEIIQGAWSALAQQVWMGDLENLDWPSEQDKKRTEKIWQRQVQGFWEFFWCITPQRDQCDVLDRRKNWRVHLPEEESGHKCMVMEGWQELSGSERIGKNDIFHMKNEEVIEKGKPLSMWRVIQSRSPMDFNKGEFLCAIAFIKRRFPRYFQKVDVPIGEVRVCGWRVPGSVPSVVYLAAVHWLEQVLKNVESSTLQPFYDAALKLTEAHGEWQTRITCIETACEQAEDRKLARNLSHQDGVVFFDIYLKDHRRFTDPDKAKKAFSALKKVYRQAAKKGINPPVPTPFYAVLVMDGDNLGVQMGREERQPKISEALNRFTGRVPEIIQNHQGFLVYAGGDDVLALLPVEDALSCAAALRRVYLDAFAEQGIFSTLSAAVTFAHVKMPLVQVLTDSHHLLDEVAKEQRGRDGLAVRVWKPGKQAVQWAMPWAKALDDDGRVQLERIAAYFHDNDPEARFSNRFFFKIRSLFGLLNPVDHTAGASTLDPDQQARLLAAEYLDSGRNAGRKDLDMERALAEIEILLQQCRPHFRTFDPETDAEATFRSSPRLEEDGALLVRFLAQKGMEA